MFLLVLGSLTQKSMRGGLVNDGGEGGLKDRWVRVKLELEVVRGVVAVEGRDTQSVISGCAVYAGWMDISTTSPYHLKMRIE
jgi:hypothetical protein